MTDFFRGHPTRRGNDGEWYYCDTGEPTVDTWRDRPCGHCGMHFTDEGHDGCLGELPGVMNACCGHGETRCAYVQFPDNSPRLAGQAAIDFFHAHGAGPMTTSPNREVSRWRPAINEARAALGLRADYYPDDLVLALIDVESDGDASARRPGSQFCGLLQMGRYAGIDVGLDDHGDDTTMQLVGDGRRAIDLWLQYQERYARLHCYQPSRMALLWKAGPGMLKRVNELLVAGEALNDAIDHAADELGVPNACEYVRRFRAAREVWASWLDEQDKLPPACLV